METSLKLNPPVPNQNHQPSTLVPSSNQEWNDSGNYLHRVIMCLVKCDKPLSRTQIAERTGIPLIALNSPLVKLKETNVGYINDCGLYTYTKNCLGNYESHYSANKTEKLMELLRKENIDVTRLRSNEVKPTIAQPSPIPLIDNSKLNDTFRQLKEKKERLRIVAEKIQSLQSEIDSLTSEKTSLEGELALFKSLISN
jgi:hypothetical protein